MPNFQYKARNTDGEIVEGVQDAVSSAAIAGQLQATGLLPLQIEECNS